jgi:organic radical activating enzyme
MKKPCLPFLETMITQVCNLSCLGCTNYSDLKHSGYVSWQDGHSSIVSWLEKIDILEFGLIGGEPLINPEWQEWLAGVRLLLPNARIRFTTNGLLLHKHPDLLEFLESLGNITFKITVHVLDSALEHEINNLQHKRSWQEVYEYGINRWAGANGLRLQINRPKKFIKTYQDSYQNMRPWQSDSVKAFENCCQQTCPLLYQNRIYKCSTAGLLLDTLSKFEFPNIELWKPYIDSGIGIESSNDDITAFVSNFGMPNKICGQCPSADDDAKINHHITVYKK